MSERIEVEMCTARRGSAERPCTAVRAMALVPRAPLKPYYTHATTSVKPYRIYTVAPL